MRSRDQPAHRRPLRSRRSRRIAAALAACALAGLLTAGLLIDAPTRHSRPAPPLPLSALHGPAVTLAGLRGHPTLVVFWASWCDPCHAEAPAIERFARSPAGRGRIIGIAEGTNSTAGRKFIAGYRWTFPVLSDPHGVTAGKYGVIGLPITVLVDGHGDIVRALIGPQTVHSLTAAIAA